MSATEILIKPTFAKIDFLEISKSWQKSKFLVKIEILEKSQNFWQTSEF